MKIYFLCSGNSNRAQIAEGFAKIYLDDPQIEYLSTSYPEEKPILQQTIHLMHEIGIDISDYQSPAFDRDFFVQASVIISICEDVLDTTLPIPPQAKLFHIQVEEPLHTSDLYTQRQLFRKVRDEIGHNIREICLNIKNTLYEQRERIH